MLYKHKFIWIEDLWFDEKPSSGKVDKIVYHQNPIERKNATPFYTMIIDLTQDEENIFNHFSKKTRAKIRSALKSEKLIYTYYIDDIDNNILNRYIAAERKFAAVKNLGAPNESLFRNYLKENKLMLSTMSTTDGEILTWNSRYVNGERARGLKTLSFFTTDDPEIHKLINLISRLHHWKDIQFLKSANYKIYDLGGWYTGTEDTKKLSINRFKEGFNGVIEKSYNSEECLTFKCYLFNILAKTKDILRGK